MDQNGDLRTANKKLLERLKKSQKEISRMIVTAKHSDPRLLSSIPLTSTVANRNASAALYESQRHVNKPITTYHKSPSAGILKRKSTASKVVLPSPVKSPASSESPSKYRIISQFLLKQSQKGENLTFSNTPSDRPLLTSPGNTRPLHVYESTRKPKSILVHTNNEKTQVTFQTPEHANVSRCESEKRKTPPLLGYDWIAGVIENTEPSPKQSDSFLEEMKEFRKVNRSECHSKRHWNEMMKTPKTPLQELSPHVKATQMKSPDPSDTRDPRIINFTINKRLFPVPVDPNDCTKPGTNKSPRYIRVSIPKSSLMSPYRYKAQHRSRFANGSDTLALPDHCVMGWQNVVPRKNEPTAQQSYTCLDLRSSLRPKENLTNLQLKSGQASIPLTAQQQHVTDASYLDESYSIRYKLMKMKNK